MSRNPALKRSLHLGPKVKLPSGHPLPEPAEGMAVKEHSPDEKGDMTIERNPYRTSDLAACLPNINRESESSDFCFDSYISELKVGQESDDGQSLFNDSEGSTLGHSSSSFMSWMDEAELEKSKEVQRLVDEVDDAIYDSVSFPVADQKAIVTLEQIRDSQLHLRLIGGQLQKFPAIANVLEEGSIDQDVIEVFASHGIYNECDEQVLPKKPTVLSQRMNADILEVQPEDCDELPFQCENKCFDGEQRTNTPSVNWDKADNTGRLLEKIKDYIMNELVHYAFSEASRCKNCVRSANLSSLSEDELQSMVSSPRPNTREESEFSYRESECVQKQSMQLQPSMSVSRYNVNDNYLQVSPMAIHHISRRPPTHLRHSANHNDSDVSAWLNHSSSHRNYFLKKEYDRFEFTGIPPISEATPVTVVSLSRNNSILPPCAEVEKGVKARGYHSAAAGTKPTLWDRRFSITSNHERFLKPVAESDITNRHRPQASAPTTPAKWLRRHTLPPIIVNSVVNPNKDLMVTPSNSPPIVTKLLESSKNKVPVSRMILNLEKRKTKENHEQATGSKRNTS